MAAHHCSVWREIFNRSSPTCCWLQLLGVKMAVMIRINRIRSEWPNQISVHSVGGYDKLYIHTQHSGSCGTVQSNSTVLHSTYNMLCHVHRLCFDHRLFETHPECKDVFFLFRDVEDLERLRSSRELRAHGLRSVTTGLHQYGTDNP